ncbi:MAG: hypothetical protein VB049_10655 [Candidatus Pelethousia sp.]|nr:hypothetical protein [Candidatus Pelethousia sp.]
MKNEVAFDIDAEKLIRKAGISREALEMTVASSLEEMDKLDPMYVSYFIPWNSI